ncbi:hypothetical protein PHMEG_0004057 [Phytophthora megakarya]|uniref:Uncharacterized protein n=1 Tax=Phytophthora megakarya TaxID=4795 RepID=A0A225WUW0_9STRA|nr:hypothetical protein PHMEG_0004057 [Phytophthora megakarya]
MKSLDKLDIEASPERRRNLAVEFADADDDSKSSYNPDEDAQDSKEDGITSGVDVEEESKEDPGICDVWQSGIQSDYQDATLLCLVWYLFGRASNLAMVHKRNISVDASNNLFLRLVRVKTSEEQGLSIFPNVDFAFCLCLPSH